MSVSAHEPTFPPHWSSAEISAVHSLIAMTGAFAQDEPEQETSSAKHEAGMHRPATGPSSRTSSSHSSADLQAIRRPRRDRRPASTYSSADYDLSTNNLPLPPKYPSAAARTLEPRPTTVPRTAAARTLPSLKRPQPDSKPDHAPPTKKPAHEHLPHPSDGTMDAHTGADQMAPHALAPINCPSSDPARAPTAPRQTSSNASSATGCDSDHSPNTPLHAAPLPSRKPKAHHGPHQSLLLSPQRQQVRMQPDVGSSPLPRSSSEQQQQQQLLSTVPVHVLAGSA